MKRPAIALLALTLPLAGCASTGFSDETEKEEVFEAYVCNKTYQQPSERQKRYANEAAMNVLADTESSPEDKKIATEVSLAYMGRNAGYDGPELTVSPDGETCHGWVWDHYYPTRRNSDEYEEFTRQDAVDAGIYE